MPFQNQAYMLQILQARTSIRDSVDVTYHYVEKIPERGLPLIQ